MRRNVVNWFLCGLVFGSALGLTALAVCVGLALIEAGADVRVYPLFVMAILAGGVCWLFKRDGHALRRHAPTYCFISRERKARIEHVL